MLFQIIQPQNGRTSNINREPHRKVPYLRKSKFASAWRTFASSLIDVFSFDLHCFRWSIFSTWSMLSYNFIESDLMPKMLASLNNNADQLSSQFVTSPYISNSRENFSRLIAYAPYG